MGEQTSPFVSKGIIQPDSLVDVFPLAVGNTWRYTYQSYYNSEGGITFTTDSGTVEMRVIANSLKPDTMIWMIEEHKSLRHRYVRYGCPPTGICIDTSYEVDRRDTTQLYELHYGRHLLISDCSNTSLGVFSFGCFTEVFVFDTGMAYRYQKVDSNGIVTVISGAQSYNKRRSVFQRLKGLITDSVQSHAEGTYGYHRNVELIDYSLILSVGTSAREIPIEHLLKQNYPNPFNPFTVIRYELPTTSDISLTIYNLLGEEIATLVNERKEPGSYSVQWDGSKYPSGVYFYRMQAGAFAQTRKLLLVR